MTPHMPKLLPLPTSCNTVYTFCALFSPLQKGAKGTGNHASIIPFFEVIVLSLVTEIFRYGHTCTMYMSECSITKLTSCHTIKVTIDLFANTH